MPYNINEAGFSREFSNLLHEALNAKRFFNPDHIKYLNHLLSHGANPETLDVEKQSGLMNACAEGNLQMYGLFLKYGANVKAKDVYGNTVLHEVLRHNHREAVTMHILATYIGRGGDINEKNKENETPLYTAAFFGNYPSVFEALIQNGAEPNYGVLICALGYTYEPQILEVILRNGGDVNAPVQDEKNTVLNFARRFKPEAVPILLRFGAR